MIAGPAAGRYRLAAMKRLLAGLVVLAAAASSSPAGEVDGAALFARTWTAADGLGPLYNETSCQACHWNGGGARFHVRPDGEVAAAGLVVRFEGGDGSLGRQLQNKAVAGLKGEGSLSLALGPDGTIAARLEPAPPAGTALSLRAAPGLEAAGLIDRVAAAAILAGADPLDRDGDGISGRPHLVPAAGGGSRVGRFGWKAAVVAIEGQVAAAASLDLGLSSPAHPDPAGDCTAGQIACRRQAGPARIELSGDAVAALAAHVRSLARPQPEPPAMVPEFVAAGCAACHRPSLAGRDGQPVTLYSDLLLHDMGEGLASAAAEGGAEAREWRTAPLVGNRPPGPAQRFLHDGRAAGVEEAVAWHGGEAAAARAAFAAMEPAARTAIVDFVTALMSGGKPAETKEP